MIEKVWTKTSYADADYIDARSKDWNTAEHRFKGFLNEGHTKDLGECSTPTLS
jgi:hypothetical protein